MIIHRSCLPTPIIPPILVRRVRGSMFNWFLVSTTSLSKFRNNPYLSERCSYATFSVLYLQWHLAWNFDIYYYEKDKAYQIDLHGGKHFPLFPRLFINEDKKKLTLSEYFLDRLKESLHQRLWLSLIHGGVQFSIERVWRR